MDHHWSSSLDLDQHSIWIITGHHHWIWIITVGSSSLDLDHHSIWIITSHHHHGCYLMILLVTGSSTEPALFHASCRLIPHVGILQHLYLTFSLERKNTHIHPGWNTSCSQSWKSSTLPSRLEHILLTMMEDFLTFI